MLKERYEDKRRVAATVQGLRVGSCALLLLATDEEERSRGSRASAFEGRHVFAAHSREASRARSDAEFCSKLDGLLQEADESQLWLELLHEDCHISGEQIDFLLKETSELLAIFTTIVSRVRKNL
jgi:hypothetical protein